MSGGRFSPNLWDKLGALATDRELASLHSARVEVREATAEAQLSQGDRTALSAMIDILAGWILTRVGNTTSPLIIFATGCALGMLLLLRRLVAGSPLISAEEQSELIKLAGTPLNFGAAALKSSDLDVASFESAGSRQVYALLRALITVAKFLHRRHLAD